MKIWDYHIPKDWKPATPAEWVWYLQRAINYGDWQGLRARDIQRYLPDLNLDPGKRLMLEAYFERYGA